MKEKNFEEFENIIKVTFNDKKLLRQAFIHRSYVNENRKFKDKHNERLEFLGDAVLELAITDYLFEKYPERNEGELTSYRSALVNAQTCSQIAKNIHVNDFILLSRGEVKDTGRARQYILANAIEAIIGAIYLDRGYKTARDFILNNFSPLVEGIVSDGSWMDSKSKFQEAAQEKVNITPSYKTLDEEGPDHDKTFTIGIYLDKELIAKGSGDSKQEAEQKAAKEALSVKNWN